MRLTNKTSLKYRHFFLFTSNYYFSWIIFLKFCVLSRFITHDIKHGGTLKSMYTTSTQYERKRFSRSRAENKRLDTHARLFFNFLALTFNRYKIKMNFEQVEVWGRKHDSLPIPWPWYRSRCCRLFFLARNSKKRSQFNLRWVNSPIVSPMTTSFCTLVWKSIVKYLLIFY